MNNNSSQFDSMPRFIYDLGSDVATVGKVGLLHALTAYPVVAGDSLEISFSGLYRMSPLVRQMFIDAQVDICAFYIPHRHIHSNWPDFVREGYDEAQTLGSDTMASGVTLNCLGAYTNPSTAYPRWFTRGLIKIWNYYFRDPSDSAGVLADDYFTTLTSASTDTMYYGLPVCHLPRLFNTNVNSTLSTSDYRLALEGGEVNLLSMSDLQGRLQTEVSREFFDLRYNDILKYSFGTGATIDQDQRPELLGMNSQYISGYDVNGTDSGNLGIFAGKGLGVITLNVPKRTFMEHGTVWITSVLRFPPVLFREQHYLLGKAEPTYADIAGDPEIVERKAPVSLLASDIVVGGGSTVLGSMPFAQWYRTHPSFAHDHFQVISGHPFLVFAPSTRVDAVYCDSSDYAGIFRDVQLGHFQIYGRFSTEKQSYIPGPKTSIFAGTR